MLLVYTHNIYTLPFPYILNFFFYLNFCKKRQELFHFQWCNSHSNVYLTERKTYTIYL